MPNRYGENEPEPGYPQADSPDIARITNPHAVDNCDLCDENGYIGGSVCDHFDHQSAAKRGMELIRESMGWQTP